MDTTREKSRRIRFDADAGITALYQDHNDLVNEVEKQTTQIDDLIERLVVAAEAITTAQRDASGARSNAKRFADERNTLASQLRSATQFIDELMVDLSKAAIKHRSMQEALGTQIRELSERLYARTPSFPIRYAPNVQTTWDFETDRMNDTVIRIVPQQFATSARFISNELDDEIGCRMVAEKTANDVAEMLVEDLYRQLLKHRAEMRRGASPF